MLNLLPNLIKLESQPIKRTSTPSIPSNIQAILTLMTCTGLESKKPINLPPLVKIKLKMDSNMLEVWWKEKSWRRPMLTKMLILTLMILHQVKIITNHKIEATIQLSNNLRSTNFKSQKENPSSAKKSRGKCLCRKMKKLKKSQKKKNTKSNMWRKAITLNRKLKSKKNIHWRRKKKGKKKKKRKKKKMKIKMKKKKKSKQKWKK